MEEYSTPCLICKTELKLTWSEVGIPYFIHSSNIICKDINPHSREMTAIVRNALLALLRSGSKITFEKECDRCLNKSVQSPPKNTCKIVKRFLYNDNNGSGSVFDIAGFDENNVLVFGINFWGSRRFANLKVRLNVPWFLIDELDVLKQKNKNNLVLRDYRDFETCGRNFCLPIREIAMKFGYFTIQPAYKSKSLRMLDEANTGSFERDKPVWSINGIPIKGEYMTKLWESFIDRGLCLFCEEPSNTLYTKPYCKICAAKVSQTKKPLKKVITNPSRREALVKNLSWMDEVPLRDCVTPSCYFCGRDNDDFIKWKDERIRCCMSCLDICLLGNNLIA
jgi:hypothetical protein